jgi:transposase
MNEKELYAFVLSVKRPWRVTKVQVNEESDVVMVSLALQVNAKVYCPECGKRAPRYDKTYKQWRHLDTGIKRTMITAEVPRIKCPDHGVKLIKVPWSERRSGYTAQFEAHVIDWLREASISAVAGQMQMSWNAVAGIQDRAIDRGLARRNARADDTPTERMGIDETSFKKGHEYVTVIHDSDTGAVLEVLQDRKKETVAEYFEELGQCGREAINSVAMDMWPAYINATLDALPDAQCKIAFDKFHVAKYLGDAVDKVRKKEHRELLKAGNSILTGSKYSWLRNPDSESQERRADQSQLRSSNLKTARAWAVKEHAMCLWNYISRSWCERAWLKWYGWAIRTRLEPIKVVARTIKKHLWGIINAIVLEANNGLAENINSRIQLVKKRSRGFRSRQRFRNAIFFHLGDLDLYPTGVYQNLTPESEDVAHSF